MVLVDQTPFRDFPHGIDFKFTRRSDCLPFLREKNNKTKQNKTKTKQNKTHTHKKTTTTKEHLLSRYRLWSDTNDKFVRQDFLFIYLFFALR